MQKVKQIRTPHSDKSLMLMAALFPNDGVWVIIDEQLWVVRDGKWVKENKKRLKGNYGKVS